MRILLWILFSLGFAVSVLGVIPAIGAVLMWFINGELAEEYRSDSFLLAWSTVIVVTVVIGGLINGLAILDRVVSEPGSGTKQEGPSSPPKAPVDSEKLIEKEMRRVRRQSGELNSSSPMHPDYKPTPKP